MITGCACYVRTYVAGSPEAQSAHLKERAHGGCAVISQGQKQSKATIARTAGSRRAWLGRGDRG